MTRTFRAGQLSQLVTFSWQLLSIYSYITAEASASLTLPSVICVHPVVKLWGQVLLLAAGQGSLGEANTVPGNPLDPPSYLPTVPYTAVSMIKTAQGRACLRLEHRCIRSPCKDQGRGPGGHVSLAGKSNWCWGELLLTRIVKNG